MKIYISYDFIYQKHFSKMDQEKKDNFKTLAKIHM